MVYVPDHHIHVFEVFGKRSQFTSHASFLDIQERCSTWLEAEAQHQRVIDQIKQPEDSVEEIRESQGAATPGQHKTEKTH